jgi:glutathione synthase/RimK-type ligase-like ATP-grasp enzyme
MKLAIATCNKYAHLAESDKPLIPLFEKHGVMARPAVWNNEHVNWQHFDAVLIRSTWDYHLHITAFEAWLKMLAHQKVPVLNPVEVLRWNLHKFYLAQLQQKGVAIIPTVFMPKGGPIHLPALKARGWHKVVIKPAVSGGAYLTSVVDMDHEAAATEQLENLAQQTDLLIQPFMPEILAEGEISMLFFNRQYSHAVIKKPATGDFRVQKEHGGITTAFSPPETIIETAAHILDLIDGPLLYARVDGIIKAGQFLLMELELIEPFLFFDYQPGAMERFVEEVAGQMG